MIGTTAHAADCLRGPASVALLHDAMENLATAEADHRDHLPALLDSALNQTDRGTEIVLISTRTIDLADAARFGALHDPSRRPMLAQIRSVNTADPDWRNASSWNDQGPSPMYIERLLQVNIAALICLATLLVGMGQQAPTMPLAMFAAALAAFWLNDFTGRVSLNRTMAGLAQVAVLLLMFFFSIELEESHPDHGPIAGLLADDPFVRKEGGSHLLAPGPVEHLLQVVVAALLVQGFLFGLLLIVSLFTALCTLTLMFLYEERSRHHSAGKTAPPPAPNGGRWPLARQDLSFSGPAAGRLGVDREFFARMLKTASASLLLGILVFLLTPRFSHGAWRGLGGGVRGSVGFDDKVRLGALVSGSILQNPQEVLTIRFYRAEGDSGASPSDRIYSVDRDLYLRGAVLTHYEHGEWRSPLAWRSARGAFSGFQQLPGGREPVRQEITIEPLSRNDLFYVWPFSIPNEAVGMVDWDPASEPLDPAFALPRKAVYLRIVDDGFRRSAQAAIVPNAERVNGIRRGAHTNAGHQDGRPTLPNLVALADELDRHVPVSQPPTVITWPLRWKRRSATRADSSTAWKGLRRPRLGPHRRFHPETPSGPLRILCHGGLGLDAPQPRHSGPGCRRIPHRRNGCS